MNNLHATLISYKNKGILFIGKSGYGKSDLALRMIIEHGAKLVADDQVVLCKKGNILYGLAPKELFGKIEVRGLGILNVKAKKQEKISLCVDLTINRNVVERLPLPETIDLLGISIPKIKLYPFDCSTTYKIILKICGNIS